MLSCLRLVGVGRCLAVGGFHEHDEHPTQLGASYLVRDFPTFIAEASERERVVAGQSRRVSLVLGAGLGLTLTDAGQAFNFVF